MRRVYFEDRGQDLIWFDIEQIFPRVGKICRAPFPILEKIYVGELVDLETLDTGKYLGILNFKDSCTDFIKYPIIKIEEIN